MLVDDEQHIIDYLTELLTGIGLEVSGYALNSESALLKISTINPDIVLLDITMPGMCGDELLKAIRQNHPMIMVIMLTSRNTSDVVKNCIENGAEGYILKSQGPDYICQKLIQFCN